MALSPAEVTHLYESILRREPNEHELAVGQTRTEESLTNSLIAAAQSDVLPFILIYQAAFNRIPDGDGLDFWVNTYREGTLNKWDYTAQIVNTPEFHAQFDHIPVADGVTQIYEQALGRTPEKSGLDFWVDQISSGKKTFTDVLYDISQSDEALGRNGDAADNLLREVAAGEADLDGSVPLPDFTPAPAPEPTPGAYSFIVGTDNKTLAAGQDAVGGTATYEDGDHITGTSNNTVFLTLNGVVTQQGILEEIDNIVLRSQAGTLVNASAWTGTETLTLDKVVGDVAVRDLQSSDTQVDIVDANKTGQKLLFTYDAQGITNGGANIGVRETFAEVKLGVENNTDAAIKTINLTINDVAGKNSTLADLIGHKTETLNIDGGFAGGKFKITDALDGTLKTIDANTAKSDLDLNVSEAGRETLNVKLGSGNDTLRTGDTLRGNSAKSNNDVIDGGAGEDTLTAVFTSGGTRIPVVTNVETFNLTFNASAVLDFRFVDDVKTVAINASSAEFRLHNLDSDVSLLKVQGAQNSATHHIYYDDNSKDSNLTVEWTSPKAANNGKWDSKDGIWQGDAGRLDVRNAGEFHFVYDGEFSTFFTDHQNDSTDDAWQFDTHLTDAVTRVLSVTNTGAGDLVLIQEDKAGYHGGGSNLSPELNGLEGTCGCYCGYYLDDYADIGGTNAVRELSFVTQDTGDIWLRDVRNVNALENLVVDANNAGSILIDTIGFSRFRDDETGHDNPSGFNAARFLQTVDISAAQRSIANVNYLNGVHNTSSQTGSNGNTVSNINIHAAVGSEANLWEVSLGDVNETTILTDSNASVGVCEWELVNNTSSGKNLGTLTVSGAGILNEQGFADEIGNDSAYDGNGYNYWVFTNQTIKSQDYSGLTQDTARIDFRYDSAGATVIGTDNNLASAKYVGFYGLSVKGDSFLGSKGADTIDAGGGDDFVYAGAGSGSGRNIIDLGSGNDFGVTADKGKTTFTTGAGKDTIIITSVGQDRTGGVDVSNNLVTDFHDEGQDTLWLDLDKVEASLSNHFAFTVGLIEGNGNGLDTGDATKFQTVNNGGVIVQSTTTVLNITGAKFDNFDALQDQLELGGTHELRTTILGSGTWGWDVNDAILVTWQDNSDEGVLHVSALRVVDSYDHGVLGRTYNFEGVDLVGLQGTSAINQVDIDFV